MANICSYNFFKHRCVIDRVYFSFFVSKLRKKDGTQECFIVNETEFVFLNKALMFSIDNIFSSHFFRSLTFVGQPCTKIDSSDASQKTISSLIGTNPRATKWIKRVDFPELPPAIKNKTAQS